MSSRESRSSLEVSGLGSSSWSHWPLRGALVAAGGAVFFGQVRSEEHCEEGRRGFGLSDLLDEDDLDLLGVFEDGYFEALVESEGVVGLPCAGGGGLRRLLRARRV